MSGQAEYIGNGMLKIFLDVVLQDDTCVKRFSKPLSTEKKYEAPDIFDYVNYHSDESGLQLYMVVAGRKRKSRSTSGASACLIYLALNAKKGI